MSAARGNAVLRPCIAQLFPDMIRYLAKVAESAETLDQGAVLWSGGKEIMQSLIQFVAGLEEGQSESLLGSSTWIKLTVKDFGNRTRRLRCAPADTDPLTGSRTQEQSSA